MNVFVLFRNTAYIAKLLDVSLIFDGRNLDKLCVIVSRDQKEVWTWNSQLGPMHRRATFDGRHVEVFDSEESKL